APPNDPSEDGRLGACRRNGDRRAGDGLCRGRQRGANRAGRDRSAGHGGHGGEGRDGADARHGRTSGDGRTSSLDAPDDEPLAAGALRGTSRPPRRDHRLYRQQAEPDRRAEALMGQAERRDPIGGGQGAPALRQFADARRAGGPGNDPRPDEPARAVPVGPTAMVAAGAAGPRSPLSGALAGAEGDDRPPVPAIAKRCHREKRRDEAIALRKAKWLRFARNDSSHQLRNCSFSTRSSRFASWSNSIVIAMSRFSWISTV